MTWKAQKGEVKSGTVKFNVPGMDNVAHALACSMDSALEGCGTVELCPESPPGVVRRLAISQYPGYS